MPVISWHSPLPYESPLSFRNNGKDSKISMGTFLPCIVSRRYNGEHVATELRQTVFLSCDKIGTNEMFFLFVFVFQLPCVTMKAARTAAAPSHELRVKSDGQIRVGQVKSVLSHIEDLWRFLNVRVKGAFDSSEKCLTSLWLKSEYFREQLFGV